MKSRWSKSQILTIPNGLSILRLMLIPVYLWLYCRKMQYGWAVGVLALSGLTDILDGWLARKFDMGSDVGKVLDPIADKLTQAALIVSLCVRYRQIWLLFGLFAVKELTVAMTGLAVLLKTDTVRGARWFGKVTTAVVEVSMGVLILFPAIPLGLANGLMVLCGVMLLFSLIKYLAYDFRFVREYRNTKGA